MIHQQNKIKESKRIYKAKYSQFDDFDAYSTQYASNLIKKNKSGSTLLELGCSEGIMTRHLIDTFNVLAVDGRADSTQHIKKLFGNKVKTRTSLFEDLKLKSSYSDIVLSHVLEHVAEPVALLKKAKRWLLKNGRIHVIVPHSNSLHRLLAYYLGFINKPNSLTKQDISVGHRRVYSRQEIYSHIQKAGLKIIYKQGVLLKPFPNQIMLLLGKSINMLLLKMGKYLPQIAGEIYIICEIK